MTSTASEIRAILGGGAEEDRVAVAHFVVGALFLVLGSILEIVALAALRFPELPISYGRLQPAANLVLVMGFGVISVIGGAYYVLPRLTGTRLFRPALAGLGLLGMSGLVVLGAAAVLAGFGSGRYPFALPWWIDAPMVLVLFAPLLVTLPTIAERQERHSFVTLWAVIGAVTWLPLLYATHFVGHAPFLSSVARAYLDSALLAGLVTMVVMVLGCGLLYYTIVRELDVALANRPLAVVGTWSLAFASIWWGVAQLTFGPGPTWIAGVAAALGLAFPIGALAHAANVTMTMEGSWNRLPENPAILAGLVGTFMAVGVGALAALGAYRPVAAVVSLTSFWKGVEYAGIAGVGALLAAGVSFAALPRLAGRDIHDPAMPRRFVRLTVAGSVGVLVTMGAAGVISGYSWIAGVNSNAFVNAGEGWGSGYGGVVDVLVLLALISAVVAFFGHAAYASTILGTIVKGPARAQEVLVSVEVDA
ncbi:MAG TPA: cbb3-type cytochrome c oxidase subunit I [Acidimicrobiia bacterium]